MIFTKEGQDSSVEYNTCNPVVHNPEVADPLPFQTKNFFHVFQLFFHFTISYPIFLTFTYVYLILGEVSE